MDYTGNNIYLNMNNNDILKDVLVFDTETTGIPAKGAKWETDYENFPRIVELAWKFNDKERDYIIYPSFWDIPPETIDVHGITLEKATTEGVQFLDIIDEFLEDCAAARLIVGHNIYFDTSIIKAMILYLCGRPYYEAKADAALDKSKRIDTMKTTIKFVGAKFKDGKPGKFPNLTELYNRCFPGETFPAHNALQDVLAVVRCVPVLVENGIIELKPKEYPVEQTKIQMPTADPIPAKTKTAKRVIEFNDTEPAAIPDNVGNFGNENENCQKESKKNHLLDENDF